MNPGIGIALAYLLGSVPASYLAGKWFGGVDLREHGSGNLGATNTFRVLGPRVALPVMLFDLFKGWAPVFVFTRWDSSPAWQWALAYGGAAILGHVFPAYTHFRGGKGVATGAGVFLALAPLAVGIGFAAWLAVLGLFRMVSLASLAATLTLLAVLLVSERRLAVVVLGAAVCLFVIFAHRANIARIARGTERRIGGADPSPGEVPR